MVALLAVGGFCTALGCSAHLRASLIRSLSNTPDLFFFVGLITLGMGALLVYGFYQLSKGHFFQVQMGSLKDVEVDVNVIAQLAREYFAALLPDAEICLDVVLHGGRKIEVIAALPDPSEHQLKQVEKELGGIFARYLNYKDTFILTVAVS